MEGSDQPLIGREAELRQLVAAINADQAIAVVGEAGIGKTVLVRAAGAAASRPVHEGGAFGTLDWLPYLALARAVRRGLGGDRATVAAQIERAVGPDALFIDDLHWADPATLAVLELLAGRILVIVAIRVGDPRSDEVQALVTSLGFTTVAVEPLAEPDAVRLVQRLRPGLSERRTADLVARAGGNPLLIEEMAMGGEPSRVLQRAITARLAALTPEGVAAVETLAIAERPLVRSALEPAAADGLEDALRHGIVIEVDAHVGLRHVLVGEAIRAAMTPDRRRAAHRTAAGAVDGPLERARHLGAAGELEDAHAVAIAAVGEMADPRARAATLAVAAETAPAELGPGLRLDAARALDEVSDWAAEVRVLGDGSWADASPEALAERDSLLARAAYALGDVELARARLAAAAEHDIDARSPAAARRAIEWATFAVNVDGDVRRAIASLDAAQAAMAKGTPDWRDFAALRESILLLATGQGNPATIMAALDEAFGAGRYRTATDFARVMQYALVMGASAEAGLAFLLAQHARFSDAGVGSVALEFKADAVLAAVLAGRLEHAATLGDELLEQPATPRARQTAEIHRARALTLMGRFEQAAASLAEVGAWASPDFFGRGEVLASQSELAFWSGRAATAEQLADAALEIRPPVPLAHATPRLHRAWARADLGLDPGPDLEFALTPSLAGAQHELAGLRAWHAAAQVPAAAAFDAAAAAWAGFHEPRALLCRWAAAESHRRAGAVTTAVARLEAAMADARAMGFQALVMRLRRSLRLAGIRDAGSARTQVLSAGGLTARERELVGLVELGLTNVEMARRLGLGQPTVTRILGSAMSKLGVSSRAQLAASVPD